MNLPMLELRMPDGAPFPWAGLWQRRNVLLLLAHPECEACRRVLADWEERADALAMENAEPIAVFPRGPGPIAGASVLLDPEERYARRLGISPGTVVAADRFFEVLATDEVHDLGADRAAADGFEWVQLAERQCPECGVGTW